MKKPTNKDRINLRVWKTDGVQTCENIVGVIHYPIAIHRSITEHEEIIAKQRKRHSARWCVTHLPTGKSFGIISVCFDKVVGYVEEIIDHPTLLMITDETMQGHPLYKDLVSRHTSAKKKWGI